MAVVDIDREEGGTIKHMWQCDSDESIHYTLSQAMGTSMQGAIKYFQDLNCAGAEIYFLSSFNEILMLWCFQSLTDSQSLLCNKWDNSIQVDVEMLKCISCLMCHSSQSKLVNCKLCQRSLHYDLI